MSGGHWDYNQSKIEHMLSEVGQDWSHTRWPKTMATMRALAPILSEVIADMDWDLSGDSMIGNDTEFDKLAHAKLVKAINGDSH